MLIKLQSVILNGKISWEIWGVWNYDIEVNPTMLFDGANWV